jgi:hypothetical protein
MSKKLAIRGHATRGKEVIEILEMMGGKNIEGYIGFDRTEIYTIEDGYIIQPYDWNDCFVLSLEEFLKKYPFKVGDKVVDGCGNKLIIKSMSWSEDCRTMVYDFEDSVIVLAAEDIEFVDGNKLSGTVDNSTEAKSCTVSLKAIEDSIDSVQFVQSGKIVAVRFNTQNYANEVELQLDDYEIKIRDGKTYAVRKKPKYPKTYEECCKVLKKNPDIKPEVRMVSPEESLLFFKFIMLKRCRDAYWKIAGEEMGLNGPWEPNSIESSPKYTITVIANKFEKRFALTQSYILAFPTEEMRDVFFENFKDLIENCKELL